MQPKRSVAVCLDNSPYTWHLFFWRVLEIGLREKSLLCHLRGRVRSLKPRPGTCPQPNNLWLSDGLSVLVKPTVKKKRLPGWEPWAPGQASLSPGQMGMPGPFIHSAGNGCGPTMCQEHRALEDQWWTLKNINKKGRGLQTKSSLSTKWSLVYCGKIDITKFTSFKCTVQRH